jgi:hypothetical protein
MADTTGRGHNRFGMPVNKSADVHASGGEKCKGGTHHRSRRTLVYVRNIGEACSVFQSRSLEHPLTGTSFTKHFSSASLLGVDR